MLASNLFSAATCRIASLFSFSTSHLPLASLRASGVRSWAVAFAVMLAQASWAINFVPPAAGYFDYTYGDANLTRTISIQGITNTGLFDRTTEVKITYDEDIVESASCSNFITLVSTSCNVNIVLKKQNVKLEGYEIKPYSFTLTATETRLSGSTTSPPITITFYVYPKQLNYGTPPEPKEPIMIYGNLFAGIKDWTWNKTGRVGTDDVDIQVTNVLKDATVGSKPVTINYAITGTARNNYTFTERSIIHTIETDNVYVFITPRPISVVFDKKSIIYGNPFPENIVDWSKGKVEGKVGTDEVGIEITSVTGPSEKNVNSSNTVTIEYELTGADKGNYVLSTPQNDEDVRITKRPVSADIEIKSKYYDGIPNAEIENIELQAEGENVGIISSDIGNIGFSIEPIYRFGDVNAGLGKRVVLHNVGALNGSNSENYEFVPPANLTGTIYRASLANMVCKEEIIICGAIEGKTEEEANDIALKTDLEKGFDSETFKSLLLNENTYIDATFGSRLNVYANDIKDLFPNGLTYLMGGYSAGHSGAPPVIWSFMEGTDTVGFVNNGVLKIKKAKLSPPSAFINNYAELEGFPVPVKVNKLDLKLYVTNVTQVYEPGRLDVKLTSYPMSLEGTPFEDNTVKPITGTAKISTDAAGVKEHKDISDIEFHGWEDSLEVAPEALNNFDIKFDNCTPITKCIGNPEWTVTIEKAPWRFTRAKFKDECMRPMTKGGKCDNATWNTNIINGVSKPVTEYRGDDSTVIFVSSNVALDKRNDIVLNKGWIWSATDAVKDFQNFNYPDPSKPGESVSYTATALYLPEGFDDKNYHIANATVDFKVLPRDTSTAIISGYPKEVNPVCGAADVMLEIMTENNETSIFYSGTNYGYGVPAIFTASGLKFGTNKVKYQIQPQHYDLKLRKDITYDFSRYLPFELVASNIRDKSYTVSVDPSVLADLGLALTDIDYDATKWYSGSQLVATGRHLNDRSSGGGDYSIILTDKSGKKYPVCSVNGQFPHPDVTPIVAPRASLAASAYGTRLVAGGTSLVLNMPNGGKVSIYTTKGELVSTTYAVDNRTIIKMPSTKGMYIVKLEAR